MKVNRGGDAQEELLWRPGKDPSSRGLRAELLVWRVAENKVAFAYQVWEVAR
jgi:hypothetical protein